MTHPLKLRAFRLLFIGRTLSALGDAVAPAALAIAVSQATGSSGALAIVLGCATVPRLLLLPVGGVVSDRIGPRRVALAAYLLNCCAQLVVALQLIGGAPSLAGLAAAAAVGGAATAFDSPSASPLVAATVDGSARLAANSLVATAVNATWLGGPALAGLLIYTAGAGWAFVFDAATFAIGAALLAVLRVDPAPAADPAADPAATASDAEPHRVSLRSDLAQGWLEVRSRDWYWSSLIAHGVWNGAASVLITLGPLIALRHLGGAGAWVATLEAGAVGMVVGAALAGRARLRRPVLVANLCLTTLALPLIALAVVRSAPVLVGAYGIAMCAVGFLNPVWETSVQHAVPAHVLSRVASYDWLLSLAFAPIGYLSAPLAANAWGPSAPLLVSAGLVSLACLGTAAAPGVRRMGAATGPGTRPRPLPDSSGQDLDDGLVSSGEWARTEK